MVLIISNIFAAFLIFTMIYMGLVVLWVYQNTAHLKTEGQQMPITKVLVTHITGKDRL